MVMLGRNDHGRVEDDVVVVLVERIAQERGGAFRRRPVHLAGERHERLRAVVAGLLRRDDLGGLLPGQGALDALCSRAKQSCFSTPSSPTRSAARGTLKAPDLSTFPTAILSYSPLLFLHLTAT